MLATLKRLRENDGFNRAAQVFQLYDRHSIASFSFQKFERTYYAANRDFCSRFNFMDGFGIGAGKILEIFGEFREGMTGNVKSQGLFFVR